MASKVIFPLPAVTSFQNIVQTNLEKKDFLRMTSATDSNPTSQVAATTTTTATTTATTYTKDAFLRVNELEKTVTLLKDEQKLMLRSLHQEIASLQIKNRDLLCQLIFKNDKRFDFTNSINDNDVKYILMSQENRKKPICCNGEIREQSNSLNDTYVSKYTIDQQQREIDYLKEQLELVSIRSRNKNRESRQADNYIRDMGERNRDQDKLIRVLRKENKEHKMEIESLRKTLNNVRLNNHMSQNIQMPHVQQQAQMFPALGTPSTLWYQNTPLPLADYHQMQRSSISANGGDRSTNNLPTNVQFTQPPMCNYRQIAVTAPPPRFYSNTGGTTGCYYTTGQLPMVRSKTYTNENCAAARSPNKNIANTSND